MRLAPVVDAMKQYEGDPHQGSVTVCQFHTIRRQRGPHKPSVGAGRSCVCRLSIFVGACPSVVRVRFRESSASYTQAEIEGPNR